MVIATRTRIPIGSNAIAGKRPGVFMCWNAEQPLLHSIQVAGFNIEQRATRSEANENCLAAHGILYSAVPLYHDHV